MTATFRNMPMVKHLNVACQITIILLISLQLINFVKFVYMKNLHVCVFTNFSKYLEFSDCRRPILTIDFLKKKNLVFECIGSWHALTVTLLHLSFFSFFFGQTDIICRIFMFVFWGKETGTQCYLKVMEYFVLKEEIISLVIFFC